MEQQKQAEAYFRNLPRHRIQITYKSANDDSAIKLAFEKELKDERKDWIGNHMEEQKQ